MAREYFWLYAGGGALMMFGFVLGAAGVLIEGAGPGHWSRACAGWFPVGPCPQGFEWLAFVVAGIALTSCGLAITRRKPAGWWFLIAMVLAQIFWSAWILLGPRDTEPARRLAGLALAGEALLIVLLSRIGAAIRRTPSRSFSHRQQAVGKSESPA